MLARSPLSALLGVFVIVANSIVISVAQPLPTTSLALTNAADIRRLTAAQAAQSIPAQLRGVVISEAGPSHNEAAVIWDETAGIYLFGLSNQFSNIKRGDLIEATGVTDPGEFAPMVRVHSVRKLGSAPTPPARRITYEDLLSGGLDGQWVEIAGVVRSLDMTMPQNMMGQWRMDIAVGGGKVSVLSNGPRPPGVALGARVRVEAACFYQFTQSRQVLRPMLFVPAGVAVHIEAAAPADPYAAQVRPVGTLLEFSPENVSGHRVHVRGVVTHQEPGAAVWIRDHSGALRIQSRQADRLQPGDEIDVLGFPKYGSYTPALEDAVFQKRKSGTPPAAIPLATSSAAFEHQADLVSLEATLAEIQPLYDGWMLTLEQKGEVFKALFRPAIDPEIASEWRPGSVVRVTGICSIIADDDTPVLSGLWLPQSFQLLLRSPHDLITLKPAPWWTPRRIILLLLILTGASLLIAAFTRRRLHEQAQRRAMAEAEFAAILSERNRLAREIHDTLAQGLTATSVQLRLAKKSSNGASESFLHHLDLAQELVRDSLQEARNSIWNMRSQVLETGDLATALKGILKQMADSTSLETDFKVTGRVRRLAPVIENNVLRVGQEAISNAVRHAEAKCLSVELVFAAKHFLLTVEDDGQGFDPTKPPPGQGGFGLVGMRERATQIHADLEISTAPAPHQGTRITLRIPLSGE